MKNLFLMKNMQQLLKNRRVNQANCVVIDLDNFTALEEDFDKASFENR